jgi:hypothetical protein
VDLKERLIEAANLVNKMNTPQSLGVLQEASEGEIDLTNDAFYCKGQSSYSAWDYFPRSLSKKQFINPYQVFRKFFKYQDLPLWRDQLNDL